VTTLGQTAPALLAVPGVSHRFFGRVGGTSPAPWRGLNTSFTVGDAPARVQENLARVRFQIGVGRRALFAPKQVHGRRVVVVEPGADPEAIADEEADAIVTRADELAVGVRTADCAPILLASDDGAVVAAAHAGWRGAVGGVLEATLEQMDRLGAPPARLVAAVGPCIGPDAFEVGPEVVEAAASVLPVDALVQPGVGDRLHFDLRGFVVALLSRAGVERVDVVGGCTATELESWFSHRAEAGRTGRQMSAIARTDPPVLDESAFA
jgi:YfiH family protein